MNLGNKLTVSSKNCLGGTALTKTQRSTIQWLIFLFRSLLIIHVIDLHFVNRRVFFLTMLGNWIRQGILCRNKRPMFHNWLRLTYNIIKLVVIIAVLLLIFLYTYSICLKCFKVIIQNEWNQRLGKFSFSLTKF